VRPPGRFFRGLRDRPRLRARRVRRRKRASLSEPGGSRSQCSDVGAERRSRGVGARSAATRRERSERSGLRADIIGARNRRNGRRGATEAGTSWSGAAPSVEATKRSGTSLRVEQSGAGRAALSLARGLAAQILLGEPAVSRSEGPCGPSERDFRSASRGRRSQPPRDADPLARQRLRRCGSRWAQRGPRRADLRRPARARSARLAGAGLKGAPFVRETSRTRRRRRGRTPPDGAQAEEEADGVTAARRWRDVCLLVHCGRCGERQRSGTKSTFIGPVRPSS
jgi:hypothetical protein